MNIHPFRYKRWAVYLLGTGYFVFLRPQLKRWGTHLGESQRRLPGDELIPSPNVDITNAINIDAPPETVWPWIAQMGRESTGYYGLDLLKNGGIPSVRFIRKDLEPPAVDMPLDGGMRIMQVEPPRLLLFGGFGLKSGFGIHQELTNLYLLERRRDGSTRLIVRRRGYVYGHAAPLFILLQEAVHFIFMFQQLPRLKALSENQFPGVQ